MVREHVRIVTFRVEQTRVVEKREEGLGFVEHRLELIGLHDHLGRLELEIDLVEIGTAPSSEMTVDVVVLVVDRCLAGIGIEFHTLLSAPGREALLQIRAGGFVVLLRGRRVERGRRTSHLPIIAQQLRGRRGEERTCV
jgi:hypothetical protein